MEQWPKDVEIMVPLKSLSNIWMTVEMQLISWDVRLMLTWSNNCFLVADTEAIIISEYRNKRLCYDQRDNFFDQPVKNDLRTYEHSKNCWSRRLLHKWFFDRLSLFYRRLEANSKSCK